MSWLMIVWNMPLSVKILGLVLLAMSFFSWAIIINQYQYLGGVAKKREQFDRAFWSGLNLQDYYESLELRQEKDPVEEIFSAGYKTLFEVTQAKRQSFQERLVQCKSVMEIAQKKWEMRHYNRLTWLATIASISPYIGLLGTVFGVIHTFQGLVSSQASSAALSAVAPGISEALGMTALGLVVAIPATIAYNRLMLWLDDMVCHYQLFQEEFMVLVRKHGSD
ncbi:MAG: MotA/TolQ/ExbB proton channel family protein [Pseudomonadota bacterium]|nr:MotA/TolQ/ExbB proton channel family protein [Pseudomonadota bacterium]